MMTQVDIIIMVVVVIFAVVSLFVNCIAVPVAVTLIWYVRRLIQDNVDSYANMEWLISSNEEFFDEFTEYHQRLEKVCSTDLYHHDDTLRGLLNHTRHIASEAERFAATYGVLLTKEPENASQKETREI